MNAKPLWSLAPATALVAGLVLSYSAMPSMAQTSSQAVAGTLTCKGNGNVGIIIGSQEQLSCSFTPNGRGFSQTYSGTINKVGLDIGVRGPNTLVWSVLFSSSELPSGALSGQFGGVSADVSLGLGAGANILVGGSNKSISLQPLSVQGQVGINIAAGVTGLTLVHQPNERRDEQLVPSGIDAGSRGATR